MKIKQFIFSLLLLTIVIMGFINASKSKFYYAYGEKIYLEELQNKIIVRYNQNKQLGKSNSSLSSELLNKKINWKDDSTCVISVEISEQNSLKEKLLLQSDIKSCNSVFKISSDLEMGVVDEILVQFLDNVSQSEIEKFNKKFNTVVIKKTELYQLLKTPKGTDALDIANQYQESGLTRFCYPNFISDVELHQFIPNDPYFINQFSLNNTGQVFTDGHSGKIDADIDAPEAWSITKGTSNITIAVLDEGLTPNHPDLPNERQIILQGSNFADGNPNDPSPTLNNNHGNGCAGIIGATQNNNQGISGIAPNCKIMPIRIFNSDGTGISQDKLADAINFAWKNGADIISNSWGYNSDEPNFFPVIIEAINTATTKGRNGLGCVVVFSAGNNLSNNGYVHFPSNANINGVITVGASDRYDLKAFYSPVGNPLSTKNQFIDIVAPSHRAYSRQIPTETFEAWTLDIPNDAGYNPVHSSDGGTLPAIGSISPNTGVNYLSYTSRFGGTSYACPQVSGVAALVLSLNPKLTQLQVYNIITNTADKVGNYVYTNNRSNELGYGRLNAFNALNNVLESNLSINGNTFICTSSVYTINNLPVGYTVSWSIPSSAGTVLQLTPNIPQQNQLTISNQKWYSVSTTLTATVKTNYGSTLSLTKKIINDNNNTNIQYGTYTQEACYFYNVYHPNQTGNLDGNAVFLNQGCTTTITLTDIEAKKVSFTGSTQPLYWNINNNILTLQLPYGSGGIPFPFKITGDGMCKERSMLFFSYSNNSTYTFALAPNPANDILTIYANPSDELISLNGGDLAVEDLEYDINIIEVNNNSILHQEKRIKGVKEHQIDISKLQKGYYILQITKGSELQTIKFLKQ